MPPRTPLRPPRTDFRQHLEVETPEHVMLDFEIAGVGSRALAAIIDTLLLGVGLIAASVAAAAAGGAGVSSGWASALWVALSFLVVWGYFTLFEGLREGQTPGKRWIGIRVLRDTGHPVTLGAAAVRNLLRIADFFPPPYLTGFLLVALHPRAKRLGDLVAGTIVARDQPAEAAAGRPAAHDPAEADAGLTAPLLTDEEFRLLDQFRARSGALDPVVRRRFAAALAARFADHLPPRPIGEEAFVLELYADESARRQGRLGSRGGAASGIGDRLAARQAARWAEFETLAVTASTRGLRALSPAQLPDFAARYREVAADLARLRTYRASPAIQSRVERLVAAGHNALYRDERATARRAWHTVAHEFPAAVLGARRYVAAAFVAFAVPLAIGFAVLRDRPSLADEVIPQVMLDRADEARARIAAGHTYAETEAGKRPFAATWIITNNVRVAFACFAGGAFAGVGSLVLLAYNGLSLGSSAGHFANVGVLGYLLEFIIGHGALELFAVWVAGAAGLMLGRAIVAPGDLTRADALVIAGRVAVRMVGASVMCLLVAGMIEGFVSTAPGGIGPRVLASAGSLAFLTIYLFAGRTRKAA